MKNDSHSDRTQTGGFISEKPEPTIGRAQLPIPLVIVTSILVFWAQMYLDRYGGGFRAEVFSPFHSYAQLEDLQQGGDPLLKRGKLVYANNCAVCHQNNGLGSPGQFPPLAGSEWVLAEGPNRLIRIVSHGLQGPITVKGVNWNLSMPELGGVLSDEDMAAVLTYIRKNKEWGHAAEGVDVETVTKVREATGRRNRPWTAAELLEIPES